MLSLFGLSTIQMLIASILLVLFLIQLFYYLYFYMQPLYRIQAEEKHQIHYNQAQPGVSVVIYANNDSEQLQANLPAFLEQDYPDYEVIVVNDGSSDESEQVLSEFEKEHSHLYHTFLSEEARNLSRKKLSLTLGIKASRNEIILLSNANCRPASSAWIKNMVRNFTEKTEVVLGYTRFEQKKGFGERFIAFDLLLRSIRFLGYALTGKPFMGEGSNMGYRKSVFFRHKGFAKYMHLHIGDDELFVNQIATKRNTKVELSSDASMVAYYEKNSEGWRYLKRNTAFTASIYRSASKWIFALESMTRYLFNGFAFAGILVFHNNPIILLSICTLVAIRWILMGIFWYQTGKKTGTRRFLLCVPLFELIDPIMNLFFKASSFFNRKRNYTWRL